MNTKTVEKVFRILFILAFVMGTAGLPSKAKAQESTGSISGIVQDYQGNPLSNIQVCAEEFTEFPSQHVGCGYTNSDGDYSIDTLPIGDYRVEGHLGIYGKVSPVWFDNTYVFTDSDKVTVKAGETTDKIDFNLGPWGSISGFVYEADGVTPMPNVFVSCENPWHAYWASTDVNGKYIFENMIPFGDATKCAAPRGGGVPDLSDEYLTEWWQEASSEEEATPIVLSENMPSAVNINFSLEKVFIEALLTGQRLHAHNWPSGTMLHMKATRSGGTICEGDATSEIVENVSVANFDIQECNPQAGDVFTVEGGGISSSMVVAALQVTGVDPAANTVSGTAPADSWIQVRIKNSPNPNLWVKANSSGHWIADFNESGDVIIPGSRGDVQQFVHHNVTRADWHVPNPYIEADPTGHWVHARNWLNGTLIHMTVERSGDIVYPADATMGPAPWNPDDIVANFDLWKPHFDLKADDVITMTGGGVTRNMTVSALQVTTIDAHAISGVAEANGEIHVWVNTGEPDKDWWIKTGSDGKWTVDFGSDLTPGTEGGTQQFDDNGNFTQIDWRVPFPIWIAPDSVPLVIGITADMVTDTILYPCFEPPYRVMADGALSPAGAAEYSSLDGFVYTITFREMNWSDGEPVIAQHYKDGLLYLLNPANPADASLFFPIVGAEDYKFGQNSDPDSVGIQALNEHALQITLEEPVVYFPKLLAHPAFIPVRLDLMAQYGDEWMSPQHLVCNGPYRLIEQDDIHILLERNPYYYNKDKVQFNQIGFSIFYSAVKDVEERLNAYNSGLLDAFWVWPRYEYKSILNDPALSEDIDISYLPGIQYLGLNTQRYPTNNALVRKALASAIDRNELINTIIGAPWHREATGVIPPEFGYQDGGVGYEFSASQAQGYLELAGFPNGAGFPEIKLISSTGHEEIVEYIAQNWRDVLNIPVKTEYYEFGDYIMLLQGCSENPADCDYNSYRLGWFIDYVDPYSILGDLFGSSAQSTGWINSEYLELLGCIKHEMNSNLRLTCVQDAERILVEDDAAVIPLYFTDRMSLVKPGIIPYFGLLPQLHMWGNSDIDDDGQQDLLDPCPADETDTCNQQGSASSAIGPEGGTLTTANENVSIQVPSSALDGYIPLSITDNGSGYLVNTDIVPIHAVSSAEIGPAGTTFATPITLTFTWQDSDNNGIVDGTTMNEVDLLLSKDGEVIAGPCGTDPACNTDTNTITIQVSSLSLFTLGGPNRPPVINQITAPLNPVQLGQGINAMVLFNDPDVGDTHTFTWNWGDGNTTGSSSASATHLYAQTGVYTISVTVIDAAGESTSATFQYVVIYDPDGGFVTGGGWIMSLAGAYTLNSSLTGKATFGFVSKYQNGANIPTGNTEFQFHVANMNFKSTSYDWLVFAGTKAQYKGTGTINDAGNYGFLLTAIDGTLDKFRIKIWDKSSDDVIYDNQLGAAVTADPMTAIGGGSIVIHKEK